MSLPEVLRGESSRLFNLPPPPAGGNAVLFIYINFALRRRDITGYIAMMMDLASLSALQLLLRKLIGRMGGTPA
jgi:chemotaxis protein CheC